MAWRQYSYSVAIALGLGVSASGWLSLPARAEEPTAAEAMVAVAEETMLSDQPTVEIEPDPFATEVISQAPFGRPETLPPSPPLVPDAPPEPREAPTLVEPTAPGETLPDSDPPPATDGITVKRFEVKGSTVFEPEEFDAALQKYLNRPLTFPELLTARETVTQMYVKEGYVTSGAFLPEQRLKAGEATVVVIKVLEGQIEDIQVTGHKRLQSSYVRSRLGRGTSSPLQIDRLEESVRLLLLNPLVDNLQVELAAGSQAGANVLNVRVTEAPTFNLQGVLNNHRIPSVGSLRRGAQLSEANLLGLGDGLSIGYGNTDGSDSVNLSYAVPFNALDGTIQFRYGTGTSTIIEPPFDVLEIESDSRYYDLSVRQPILKRYPRGGAAEEVALGLSLFHIRSNTTLLDIPFPLSAGADINGRTRVSALRFSQEWTKQSRNQVLAARSQFSFGLNAFGSTINEVAPDSRFFSWRGQFQWVRLLARPSGNPSAAPTFLLRADLQVADRPLLSLEQFAIGGASSVRGYREDVLLTDNGLFASAELRLPVLRIPSLDTTVSLIPFVDLGRGWNNGEAEDPDPQLLASVGLGLQITHSEFFTARLDWGIPLVDVVSSERTWQENGLHFSLNFNLF